MLDTVNRIFVRHAADLFDPALLRQLRQRFIEGEAEMQTKSGTLPERERQAVERGESSDDFRMRDHWYDVWRDASYREKLIEALHPFTYVMFPVQVRHVRAVGHAVPWHQDAGYMQLHPASKRHKKVITCFIPIEDEPANCTTVQFARDNEKAPDQEMPHKAMDGFGAGVAAEQCKDCYHYDLALGDALVFGDLVLHRTFTPPGAEVERRSLEFRLIDPADALEGKDYFDIRQGMFVQTNGNKRKAIHG